MKSLADGKRTLTTDDANIIKILNDNKMTWLGLQLHILHCTLNQYIEGLFEIRNSITNLYGMYHSPLTSYGPDENVEILYTVLYGNSTIIDCEKDCFMGMVENNSYKIATNTDLAFNKPNYFHTKQPICHYIMASQGANPFFKPKLGAIDGAFYENCPATTVIMELQKEYNKIYLMKIEKKVIETPKKLSGFVGTLTYMLKPKTLSRLSTYLLQYTNIPTYVITADLGSPDDEGFLPTFAPYNENTLANIEKNAFNINVIRTSDILEQYDWDWDNNKSL